MGRLLAVLLLLSACGFAQTTCVNCGGGAYASGGTGTINVLLKGDGAGFGANSSITDDAVKVTGTLPMRMGDGTAAAPTYSFTNATGEGMVNLSNNGTGFMFNTANWASIQSGNFQLPSGVVVGWPNSTTIAAAANDINISRSAAGVLAVGTGSTPGNTAGTVSLTSIQYRGLAQTYFVTSDFTTSGSGTALELITGLSFTFPASIAINAKLDCYLNYNQNVAAVAVAFGFQDASVAPTNLAGWGRMGTNTTAFTAGTLAASATTTATSVVSATPSAITTIWPAELHFFIEQPSNASTSVFSVRVSTATAADTVTVKRGSYCTLQQ